MKNKDMRIKVSQITFFLKERVCDLAFYVRVLIFF
jgi:hypothetical protein